MKYSSCPISTDVVNSKLTRIYSIVTFIAIGIYLFTPFKEIIYLSATDFIIRVFIGVKYSPICFFIKKGLALGQIQTHMVNAGPKKFAAKIGLVFTVLMSFSALLDLSSVSFILGSISFLAVGAEAVIGFCVACYIYTFIPDSMKK